MDASTGLLGSLPELDSMAVAELLAAVEHRFGFEVTAPISRAIFSRRSARSPRTLKQNGREEPLRSITPVVYFFTNEATFRWRGAGG